VGIRREEETVKKRSYFSLPISTIAIQSKNSSISILFYYSERERERKRHIDNGDRVGGSS
jgi:hypothetical protein